MNFDAKKRQWAYGIVGAGLAVAAGYGLIAETHVTLWLNLAGALLLGMASAKSFDPETDADMIVLPFDETELENPDTAGDHGNGAV